MGEDGKIDGNKSGAAVKHTRACLTVNEKGRSGLFLCFGLRFFFLEAHLIFANKGTEFRVVILLAVQRIVKRALRMFF